MLQPVMNFPKFLMTVIFVTFYLNSAISSENVNQENLLLKIPGLTEIGSVSAGWMIVRKGNFWNGSKKLDLNQMAWPFWDKNQIPALLVPAQNQTSVLEIFDANKKSFYKKTLIEPFSFNEVERKSKITAKFFRITNLELNGRIEAQTPIMELPSSRSILTCQLKSLEGSILSSSKFNSCLNSLKGYFVEDQPLTQQMYIKFVWPKPKDRIERIGFKQKIRDFKVLSKKKNMIFISDEGDSDQFNAEIGITNAELLPDIKFANLQNLNFERALLAPKAYEEKKLAYEFLQDESKISFYIFSEDVVSKSMYKEATSETVHTTLQIIGDAKISEPEFSTTATLENRTGLGSLFRNVKVSAFANTNVLVSNKGERESIFGLPGFEVESYFSEYSMYPFVKIENQLIHFDSRLAITEISIGSLFKVKNWHGLRSKFGYLQYSLSGTNDGASRLGVFRSPFVGVQFDKRDDQWTYFGGIDIFAARSFSYSVKAGTSWSSPIKTSEYLQQLGISIGYSDYRASIINKLDNVENLSESRFQISFIAGILGPDFIGSFVD